ncbi:MAG: hypothetical protein ACYDAZ_09035, partial [Thermoplasmataceae archaeon]
ELTERLRVLEVTTSRFRKLEEDGKGFKNLSEIERKAIAGTLSNKTSVGRYGIGMGWFGSMRGAGMYKHQVINNNANLSRAIDAIPASGEVRVDHYRSFVKAFRKMGKGGIATGTRLLAMKRPDVFVCLDKKNKANLCKDFGIAAAKMTFERYWDEIIGRISESAWWNAPAPKSGQELKVWQDRSAFLDSIYYED